MFQGKKEALSPKTQGRSALVPLLTTSLCWDSHQGLHQRISCFPVSGLAIEALEVLAKQILDIIRRDGVVGEPLLAVNDGPGSKHHHKAIAKPFVERRRVNILGVAVIVRGDVVEAAMESVVLKHLLDGVHQNSPESGWDGGVRDRWFATPIPRLGPALKEIEGAGQINVFVCGAPQSFEMRENRVEGHGTREHGTEELRPQPTQSHGSVGQPKT